MQSSTKLVFTCWKYGFMGRPGFDKFSGLWKLECNWILKMHLILRIFVAKMPLKFARHLNMTRGCIHVSECKKIKSAIKLFFELSREIYHVLCMLCKASFFGHLFYLLTTHFFCFFVTLSAVVKFIFYLISEILWKRYAAPYRFKFLQAFAPVLCRSNRAYEHILQIRFWKSR